MKQTKYEATTRYQFVILLFSWKSHTKHVGESHEVRKPQFAHRWYRSLVLKNVRITGI